MVRPSWMVIADILEDGLTCIGFVSIHLYPNLAVVIEQELVRSSL